MKDVQVVEILKQSFEDFKKNWKVLLGMFAALVGVVVLWWLVLIIMGVISQGVSGSPVGVILAAVFQYILFFAYYYFQVVLGIGVIYIVVSVASGKPASVSALFLNYKNYPLVLAYLFCSMAVGVLGVAGFLFFIIPVFIVLVRLQLALYFVVDKGSDVVESITQSWNATRGLFWKILLFDIVLIVINFVAAIVFVLPLLITIPVSMVAVARLYRKISG